MKTTLTAMFILAMTILLIAPSQSFAQTPDTVTVYADAPGSGGPTIEQFISGDTTSTGQRKNPNRVYLLQQTGAVDTPYYYTDPIILKSNNPIDITILGKINPTTGMPPVIQPFPRQNNTAPSNFIESSTTNTIRLNNLYILGQRYDSLQATGNLLQVSGDSSTVYLDHCVIDNASGNVANFSGNWDKLIVNNTELRNLSNQFWRSGDLMWALNGVPMDTVIIQNSTFFCQGRSIYGGPGYYKYVLFNHNTVFLTSDDAFLSTHQTNATFTNNIFYGVAAHAADSNFVATGQCNDAKEPYGVIMMDSLRTIGSVYGFTEAQRNVVVENNAYFWPDGLVTMWKTINDTAKGWYIALPTWMNPQTEKMFNDKTSWPGFKTANNDSVDPGFSQSVVSTSVDNLTKFEQLVGWKTPYGNWGNSGTFRWWTFWTNPYPGYIYNQVPSTWKGWQDGYPVPEDLKYTNVSLQTMGTDNKPLGDLNWFAGITGVKQLSNTTPTKFELNQNYPNPFNPSTEIKYEIPKSGLVSLKVYNILGQEVATLFNGFQKSGVYKVNFNASKLASGVYLYRLESNGLTLTKKMILMK